MPTWKRNLRSNKLWSHLEFRFASSPNHVLRSCSLETKYVHSKMHELGCGFSIWCEQPLIHLNLCWANFGPLGDFCAHKMSYSKKNLDHEQSWVFNWIGQGKIFLTAMTSMSSLCSVHFISIDTRRNLNNHWVAYLSKFCYAGKVSLSFSSLYVHVQSMFF